MKNVTRVNHPPAVDVPAGNRPLIAPIYQSVKFHFESLEETERSLRGETPGFFYSRASNPTVRQLELLVAQLQGRDEALVTASGVAAIGMCLLALLKQGDHVVCFVESYSPARYMVRRMFARFGVTHTLLSIEDMAGLEKTLSEKPTRLVLFESPTNPMTKIADLERMTALARQYGALTVLDNTFAGLHNHGQYPVDIFLHSLTKYASGHGDVMAGAIIASKDIIGGMRTDATVFGAMLDAHAAFLVLRGLRTYYVRRREQCSTAQKLAEFLVGHPLVKTVHYPGLASHPHHALARKQMEDFGSILTFEIRGGAEAGRRFVDALTLFSLAGSLGATESLVMAPQLLRPRDLSAEHAVVSGITEGTIRLSIGLEDPEDLQVDLAQALEKSHA